jgi:methionyl-tRNA formyltransferase
MSDVRPGKLRLCFMGTPDFSVPILAALLATGHEVVAVYCQPPRPAGRGHRLQPSPVQVFSDNRSLPVRTPVSLKDPAVQAEFAALDLDAAVVAAYGLLLPKPVLAAPRLGCINVHASLLPRWRGAAPIQRAILAGDSESGVTIMRMEAGLDTGPMLLSARIPLTARMTGGELHDRLSQLGAELIVEALAGLAANRITPEPQPEEGITYAAKLAREEMRLDWRQPAPLLDRVVRAFAPGPGAWFEHEGERLKVLEAAPESCPDGSRERPGTLLDDRLGVACGSGILRLLRLQRAGRDAVDAAAFLRGRPIPRGTGLPCPDTRCPATS